MAASRGPDRAWMASVLVLLAAAVMSLASAAAPGHALPYASSCFPSHSTYIRAVLKHSVDAVGSYGDPYASILVVGGKQSGLEHFMQVVADRLSPLGYSSPATFDIVKDTDSNSGSVLPAVADRLRPYLESQNTAEGLKGDDAELKVVVIEGLSTVDAADTPRLNLLLRLLAGQKGERSTIPVSSTSGNNDIEVAGKALYLLAFDLDQHAAWVQKQQADNNNVLGLSRVRSFLKAVSRPAANPLATDDASSPSSSEGAAAVPDIRGTEALVKTYLHSLWANLTAAAYASQAQARADGKSGNSVNAQARPLTPEAVIGRLQQVLLLRPSMPAGDWEAKAAANDRCRPRKASSSLLSVGSVLSTVRSHLPPGVSAHASDSSLLGVIGGSVVLLMLPVLLLVRRKAPAESKTASASVAAGEESEKPNKTPARSAGAKRQAASAAARATKEAEDGDAGTDDGTDAETSSVVSSRVGEAPEDDDSNGGGKSANAGSQRKAAHRPAKSAASVSASSTAVASAAAMSAAAGSAARQRAASGGARKRKQSESS